MIFVDTGFLVALYDPRDPRHDLAVDLHAKYLHGGRETLLTTHAVLHEVLAHFSRGGGATRLNAASQTWDILDGDRWRVVTVDDGLFRRGLRLHGKRPDKRCSLVDCIGMTVSWEEGVTEVLATDVDFEQERFVNLMRLAQ